MNAEPWVAVEKVAQDLGIGKDKRAVEIAIEDFEAAVLAHLTVANLQVVAA